MKTSDELKKEFPFEHPKYTRAEHACEVQCGNTMQPDYWEWVAEYVNE